MKLVQILGCALLVLVVATRGTQAGDKKGVSKKTAEIKKLLKERRDTLAKVVKGLTDHYAQGFGDFSKVAQAQLDLLKANLDLADNLNERIVLLRKQKELAESILKLTEKKARSGSTTSLDVLQANASLLEVQIALLREEQKVKPEK
jgi:outer membrane protein TolC